MADMDLEIKPQSQSRQPGRQAEMDPPPRGFMEDYKASGRLEGRRALITGGDSGIGRAVAIGYAMEGADVVIVYLEEEDAVETCRRVEAVGRKCVCIRGDITSPEFCRQAVERTVGELGGLDILVNNAAEQHEQDSVADITPEQLERTFRTNVFAMFYLTAAAMPHIESMKGCIINTTSVTAYKGKPSLIDYSATKGAIVAFTRALSQNLAEKGVRVNAVAPGPIWTPLIPASFTPEEVAEFGKKSALGRPGQPDEVAPAYIFLASADASYMTGQVMHPNGGEIVNG